MQGESGWETHPWVSEDTGRVRFSVALGPQSDWPTLVQFVQRCEALGFDAYWAEDHPIRHSSCWTTLAGLAPLTRSIRLGALVNCVHYRSAAELARMAADVDRMSDGRLILGLGVGIDDQEYRALGLRMPPVRQRLVDLEQMIQAVRQFWSESMAPRPVQTPRVPLLIAGGGEKSTLRQVAQFADAANLVPSASMGPMDGLTAEDVRRKLAVLEQHCAAFNRSATSVLVTHSALPVILSASRDRANEKLNAVPERTRARFRTTGIIGTPDEVQNVFQGLADLGLNYFVAWILGNDVETLELLASEVVPHVGIRVAGTA